MPTPLMDRIARIIKTLRVYEIDGPAALRKALESHEPEEDVAVVMDMPLRDFLYFRLSDLLTLAEKLDEAHKGDAPPK